MLTNAHLSELLSRASAEETEHRQRALRRAARAAMASWTEEAGALQEAGRPLTELPAVGPWVAHRLREWIEEGSAPGERPPIRSGFLTLAEVSAALGEDPSLEASLRADLQMHTTYSDGRDSIRAMAEASAARGYSHVLITDHSKGLKIARGMHEERLAEQAGELAAVNESLAADAIPLTALHGLEMNLSPSGEGDMDPAALAKLDLVLGAFHSKLRETEDQTERYLAALANPTIHVLAHPRGRRYDHRLGLSADWPRVFAAAEAHGVALEIDAFPDRQDLNVELLRVARDAGCWISIGTDAHRVGELRYMEFGLAAAVLADLPRDRILNLLDRDLLLTWARERSDRRGAPAAGSSDAARRRRSSIRVPGARP